MKIIGIAAGKGGVGKSTIALNLAEALTLIGYRVGLLDADLYGPSLARMLPVDKEAVETDERLEPAQARGLQFLSLGLFRKQAMVVRAPIANRIIEQFVAADWEDLDYLIVDFPPGTGDIQLTLLQKMAFNGVILVTLPQKISLDDVERTAEMFEQMQIPLLGVIENMSYLASHPEIAPFGRGAGSFLAERYGCPSLAQVALDSEICSCADLGSSLFASGSRSPDLFLGLAEKLVATLRAPEDELPHVTISQEGAVFDWPVVGIKNWKAAEIQKRCPCILCRDGGQIIDERVVIREVENIGRYALRFAFSSGCSRGLYPIRFFHPDALSKVSHE